MSSFVPHELSRVEVRARLHVSAATRKVVLGCWGGKTHHPVREECRRFAVWEGSVW